MAIRGHMPCGKAICGHMPCGKGNSWPYALWKKGNSWSYALWKGQFMTMLPVKRAIRGHVPYKKGNLPCENSNAWPYAL